jgi:putative transposase
VFVRHTTFRYRIDPTAETEALLRRHVGASRFAFNQSLRVHLNARRSGGERPAPWSGFDLINTFNAWKKTEQAGRVFTVDTNGRAEVLVTGLRWRGEVCQQVFEEAAVDCGRALGAWTASRRGKRRGRKVGHPRFKRKTDASGSFRVRNKTSAKSGRCCIRVGDGDDLRSVTLPGVGTVRVFDNTRPLRKLIAAGRGKILFATIRHTPAGRWTISLNVQAADLHPAHRHPADTPGTWVGIDRGLSALAVGASSDGTEVLRVNAPRSLTGGLRKQRTLAKNVSRKPKGSANRRRATRRLARHHETVANRRKHFIHQVTNGLVKTHDRLVLEDLNVSGMLQNPKLARHIADAAWATLHHQLAYKQAWTDGQLTLADRWFASSQTCSGCGCLQRLSLADRVFNCGACGLVIDRDLNAAVNLAAWAENHAQAPDRQADGRDINACREARSGPRSGAGETSLDEAGTQGQAHAA